MVQKNAYFTLLFLITLYILIISIEYRVVDKNSIISYKCIINVFTIATWSSIWYMRNMRNSQKPLISRSQVLAVLF